MLYPGYGLCGTLHVCHISFPPSCTTMRRSRSRPTASLRFRRVNGRPQRIGRGRPVHRRRRGLLRRPLLFRHVVSEGGRRICPPRRPLIDDPLPRNAGERDRLRPPGRNHRREASPEEQGSPAGAGRTGRYGRPRPRPFPRRGDAGSSSGSWPPGSKSRF